MYITYFVEHQIRVVEIVYQETDRIPILCNWNIEAKHHQTRQIEIWSSIMFSNMTASNSLRKRGYSNNLSFQFFRWQILLIDTYCLYFRTTRKRKTSQTLKNTRSFYSSWKRIWQLRWQQCSHLRALFNFKHITKFTYISNPCIYNLPCHDDKNMRQMPDASLIQAVPLDVLSIEALLAR